jgi:hypothetical protein
MINKPHFNRKEAKMRKRMKAVAATLMPLLLAAGLFAQGSPSILPAVASGEVRIDFSGTGGSSGDSVRARVSKGYKATPGAHTYSVPPGTMLASSDAGAQSMMIAGVAGRETSSESYTPSSTITVPPNGAATYILKAFCAEFHKENPSESTTFSLRAPDPVLACIARSGQGLSVPAFQAAVWMYTDNATYGTVNEKFTVSRQDWASAERVFQRCH